MLRIEAASRRMSAVSAVAMTARSYCAAVATTKASTACAEDSLLRARSWPARCATARVRSATRIARELRRRLTAASLRPPRQTSARTGAGTRISAAVSCATTRIARALALRAARPAGWASALSASESRTIVSAIGDARELAQRVELGPVRRPSRQEERRDADARVRARSRGLQSRRGLAPPRCVATPRQVRRGRLPKASQQADAFRIPTMVG